MYPGSIRTESIESIDADFRQSGFPASNIDGHGEEISQGELQITDDNLIYFKPSKFPTRWPLDCIRRYGYLPNEQKFVFEAGRKCSTGQGIYAFRLSHNHIQEFVFKLREKIEKLSANNNKSRINNLTAYDNNVETNNNDNDAINRTIRQQKDASTTTEPTSNYDLRASADPHPIPYTMIDFETTKALNELAQAHAANRDR